MLLSLSSIIAGSPWLALDNSVLLFALTSCSSIGRCEPHSAQGFIQYRASGESSHLDVDTLNERLKLKGAERMRTAMRPDEAFGMIFSWDGVIADMQEVGACRSHVIGSALTLQLLP